MHDAFFEPHDNHLRSSDSSSTTSNIFPKSSSCDTTSDSDSDDDETLSDSSNAETIATPQNHELEADISEWLEDIRNPFQSANFITKNQYLEFGSCCPARKANDRESAATTHTINVQPPRYSYENDIDVDMRSSHPSSIADVEDLYEDENITDYRDLMALKRKRIEEEVANDSNVNVDYALRRFKRFKLA